MSAHPFDVFIIRSQRFGYREYEGGKGAKFGGGGGQPFLLQMARLVATGLLSV